MKRLAKAALKFLGFLLFGCAFLVLCVLIFGPYVFEFKQAKVISPNSKYVATYYISTNEGGFAPYGNYVEIRPSYKFWQRPNIKNAPFVGYCDVSHKSELVTWLSDTKLLINCNMKYCGIIKQEPRFNDIEITYNISGKKSLCNLLAGCKTPPTFRKIRFYY